MAATLDPKMAEMIEMIGGGDKLADLSPGEARENLARQVREEGERLAVEGATISGPDRDVPVRVYRPAGSEGPLPTLVYLHGGGWVVGEIGACADRAQALADRARCLVLAVDYRLAPEDKFPAGLDDVWSVVEWLGCHAERLGGDPARLALMGDSSGANLAAAAALKSRDSSGPAICAQVLACPLLDFEFSSPSMVSNAEGYLMECRDLRWCWGHYLARETDGGNPYASPARAESLAGLPPTLVITAQFDPLRDQGEAFGRRLARDGIAATVSRYEGVVHSFVEYDALDQAARALDETVAFLGAAWAPPV